MSFQIETERLIIRDLRRRDIPTLLAQSGEREARRNILHHHADETYNRRVFENAILWAKCPQRAYYTLSVVLKSKPVLIGSCMISDVRPESVETSIGWHYGHEFRGNGYATEAARCLLRIGFEMNEVSEIYADCFADNPASIRIMEKIGMRSDWKLDLLSTIRGWSYGENRPIIRYNITKWQWLELTN
ncbi:MAG: GNAT family N-acetyltransferase [Pyrinomonadaceae bacterium]